MLKRYGAVASGVAEVLDPYLDRLIELIHTAGMQLQMHTCARSDHHEQEPRNMKKENEHGS